MFSWSSHILLNFDLVQSESTRIGLARARFLFNRLVKFSSKSERQFIHTFGLAGMKLITFLAVFSYSACAMAAEDSGTLGVWDSPYSKSSGEKSVQQKAKGSEKVQVLEGQGGKTVAPQDGLKKDVAKESFESEKARSEKASQNEPEIRAESFSPRTYKKAGVDLGLLGEPYPSLIGVNFEYHFLEYLRFSAGVGTQSAATSAGKNIRALTLGGMVQFFVPGLALSPAAGIGFAYSPFIHSSSIPISSSAELPAIAGKTDSFGHSFLQLGLDWVSLIGFHFALGYEISFFASVSSVPYLAVGWYFGSGP